MSTDTPKRFSPATFALALFCFLLPFVTISCPGGQVTLSGFDLVEGTEIEGKKVDGEPLAGLAFLAALIGLGASFLKSREGFIGAGLAGGVGAALLLVVQSKIKNDALEETGGLATLNWEIGYWLALLALVGGSVLSFYLQSRAAGSGTERSGSAPAQAAPSPSEGLPKSRESGSA